MKTIFGLPAHPLVVHLAVVLVPLTALAMIVVAFRPSWRRRYNVPLLVLSAVGFVAMLAARGTGEKMYSWMNQDPPVAHHRDLANVATVLALLFLLASGGLWAVERRGSGDGSSRRASTAVASLAAIIGVLVIVWVARTGHEGARLTWKYTVQGGK